MLEENVLETVQRGLALGRTMLLSRFRGIAHNCYVYVVSALGPVSASLSYRRLFMIALLGTAVFCVGSATAYAAVVAKLTGMSDDE